MSFLGNALKKTGELFQKTVSERNRTCETLCYQGVYRSPKNWGTHNFITISLLNFINGVDKNDWKYYQFYFRG
jgi:hypothetical protein